MELREKYNLDNLRNRTAEMVFRKIGELLDERGDICACENCVLDLAAYTLNHTTPLYATSLLDPLQPNTEKERKVHVEIDIALKSALKRVRMRPHHYAKHAKD
jgi:competence protein ComFB